MVNSFLAEGILFGVRRIGAASTETMALSMATCKNEFDDVQEEARVGVATPPAKK